MAHGASKGQLDSKFTQRIEDLERYARQAAEAFRNNSTYRPWALPPGYASRDLSDIPGLHEPAWNRNNINQLYSETILQGPGAQGGTSGDLIAMKWQADFMATEERAFRTRHASRARCLAHMHGRLDGHGKTGKSIFSFLKDGVQNAIDLGRAHGS